MGYVLLSIVVPARHSISAFVHIFNISFSNEHLYRAGQSMNSLPSQILNVGRNFMMTRIITTFVLNILTATIACSQNIEPLDLAKKIFSKEHFNDINNYITGEYKNESKGRPTGQDLPTGSNLTFSLLEQTTNKAVVDMTVQDTTGKGIDTYLFFEKDEVWKMDAFRALALTGIIEQVKNGLEKMTPEQVDSLINKSKNEKNKDIAIFSSREDFNFQLGNAKLTLELDTNIIKHFLDNNTEFERIKDSALKELESKKPNEEQRIKLVENLKPDYQKLFISSVSYGDDGLENCIDFLIGGITDNSVGYIYVNDKKDLPHMDADKIIMIKEIGNGWYIYKTT